MTPLEAEVRELTTSLADARTERNRCQRAYEASQRAVVGLRLRLAEARTRQRLGQQEEEKAQPCA